MNVLRFSKLNTLCQECGKTAYFFHHMPYWWSSKLCFLSWLHLHIQVGISFLKPTTKWRMDLIAWNFLFALQHTQGSSNILFVSFKCVTQLFFISFICDVKTMGHFLSLVSETLVHCNIQLQSSVLRGIWEFSYNAISMVDCHDKTCIA